MAKFVNIFDDSLLKCDFPARESFREALLERLKSDVAQKAQTGFDFAAAIDEELEWAELTDDDLCLIAAAGGQPIDKPVVPPDII